MTLSFPNSTLILSTLRTRLQNLLIDTGVLIWSTDTLDEAIRQALADLSGAGGEAFTLKDLDAADYTTIDARDDDLLIRGAAGYAAKSRSIDRAEMANLSPGTPSLLFEWGKNQLWVFEEKLRLVRKRSLDNSTAAPSAGLTWDETDKNW